MREKFRRLIGLVKAVARKTGVLLQDWWSSIAGAAGVPFGCWKCVAAYGVSQTGTPIATLSGGAKFMATLSALGGVPGIIGLAILGFILGPRVWRMLKALWRFLFPGELTPVPV